MPSAWAVYNQMEKEPAALPAEVTDDGLIEKNATDTRYAVLASIEGVEPAMEKGKPALRMRFRVADSLKGAVPPGLEFSMTYPKTNAEEELVGGSHFGELKKGAGVVALFDVPPDRPEPDAVANGYYYVLPLTARTLAAVQRGIARDKLADAP